MPLFSSSSPDDGGSILRRPLDVFPKLFRHETRVIGAVVLFYYVVSISLVVLNKAVLNAQSLPYPLFVTWTQLVVALACIWAISAIKRWHVFSSSSSRRQPKLMPGLPAMRLEFDADKARRIVPLTIVYVLMVASTNLCLQYVQVSFFQTARSLTILFSICFTAIFLHTSTSFKACLGCLVVMIGFALGSIGEVEFSWVGLAYGLLSSAFVALYGIFVRRVLPVVENNSWRLMAYNTEMAMLAMLPLIVVSGEAAELPAALAQMDGATLGALALSGVFGFLINIAVFLQIKYTSPLTNNMSGTFKGCFQLAITAYIFGDTVTPMNVAGSLLVVAGTVWYSHVRYGEMNAERHR